MSFLSNLFSGSKPKTKPQPLSTYYIIGDIHGRADLLEKLLAKIDAEKSSDAQIVCVGDYIDRGDNGADVLSAVFARDKKDPNFTALYGNHEELMLDFLDKPDIAANRWLRNGGLQTLAGFKIGGFGENAPSDKTKQAAEDLRKAMPKGMEDWLRTLPRTTSSGNLHIVHAGADPAIAMEDQDPHTLTWGHKDFAKKSRNDGAWVAYGHIITETPGPDKLGRIAVDTGAYYSGKLTAAKVTPEGEITLITT